jgi:ankyrin repeat protein
VLVAAHANVDQARTDTGSTPLCIAAQMGHVDVVRVLAGAGANLDQAKTTDGATPLFIAAQKGYVDILQTLIDAGANINQVMTGVNFKSNATGSSPLFVAAQFGQVDVIKVLAAAGADLHAADSDGTTPLQAALKWGTPEAVAALRAAGATLEQATTAANAAPLFATAQQKDPDVDRADSLLAALDIATSSDKSPSETAVALAAAIVVRAETDAFLASRLAAARLKAEKGRQ